MTVSGPEAVTGTSTGTVRVTSSPRYERMRIFSGTVRPGRTFVVSSQMRSIVAVRGSSVAVIAMSMPSISTGS